MADPGQPFQVTDVLSPGPGLPDRRMICAYRMVDPDDGSFVVEWEYGGIAHGRGRTVFRQVGAAYVPQ